ncbi:MAG: right-handed parallel beta-helix repeat-containing protein [Verrucomicrobiales bacterium]|nr:right-handed parallel beta-helix repeat-containing protein [Verrucomicrobiales bacterium]
MTTEPFGLVRGIALRIITISVFLAGNLYAEESDLASEHPEEGPKWHSTSNVQYKGGNSRHIGQLGFTIPFAQNEDTLLFLDFRGRIDDQDTEEFNLGLAYRKLLPNEWIFGAYGFFDRNTTAYGNEFDQGTVGFEFLSEDWDFRVNGYLPDLKGQDAGLAPGFGSISTIGNQFVIDTRRLEERAYYGGDYEIGKRVVVFGENENEVRVFGGGYYFDNDAPGYAYIAGARVRIEARLFDLAMFGEGSRVTLCGDVQWDQVRDTQGFGGIAIQIPIGKWTKGSLAPIGTSSRYGGLTNLGRRMYDPIIRDIDVVSQSASIGNAADLLLDEEGDPLFFANSDYSLNSAIASAGENGSVTVNGEVTTSGSTLLKGQRLNSVTSIQTVVGAESGIRITGPLPGDQGVIKGNSVAPLVTIANRTLVDGLRFEGGSSAISGSSIENAVIRKNIITGASGDGISLAGRFTGMIVNNEVSSNSGNGILVEINDGTIQSNTADSNGVDGIGVGTNYGRLQDNIAKLNIDDGIDVETNEGTIAGNSAMLNLDDGFHVEINMPDGVIRENTAGLNGNDGFYVSSNKGVVGNNRSVSNLHDGFHVEINGPSGVVQNNTASQNEVDGFSIGTVQNGGIIRNNTANLNESNGFYVTANRGILNENISESNLAGGFIIETNGLDGVLQNNTASRNESDGFYVGTNHGEGIIRFNTANSNKGDGFYVDTNRGTLNANTSSSNLSTGFQVETASSTSVIQNNEARLNEEDGIFVVTNQGVIRSNTSSSNLGDGFEITTNTVDGKVRVNDANDNEGQGYRIMTNAGAVTGNTGTGNTGGVNTAP